VDEKKNDPRHFTPGRFFPLAFVEAALGGLVSRGVAVADAPSLNAVALTSVLRSLVGVDYDAYLQRALSQCRDSHELFANFNAEDFTWALPERGDGPPVPLVELLGSAKRDIKSTSESLLRMPVVYCPSRAEIENNDKLVLESYGKPQPKPGVSGVYFSFPRTTPLRRLMKII